MKVTPLIDRCHNSVITIELTFLCSDEETVIKLKISLKEITISDFIFPNDGI